MTLGEDLSAGRATARQPTANRRRPTPRLTLTRANQNFVAVITTSGVLIPAQNPALDFVAVITTSVVLIPAAESAPDFA